MWVLGSCQGFWILSIFACNSSIDVIKDICSPLQGRPQQINADQLDILSLFLSVQSSLCKSPCFSLMLSFLWALKSDGSAFCAERDASCGLMLCLLFWAGSQRAVVVCCCFSIHASPSLSTLNQPPPHTEPPTPFLSHSHPELQHTYLAQIRTCVLIRPPQNRDTHSHTHINTLPSATLISAYLLLLS